MNSPLVLLHGFTGAPSSWSDVQARLPQDRPAWALPLLGHHPNLLDPALGSGGFIGEVDRLGLCIAARFDRPVHVCGYSLGGRLALGLAARRPSLVDRITVIGAHAGLHTAQERAERVAADEMWAQRLDREGITTFTDAWEAQPLFATQRGLDPARSARLRAERLGHDPAGLALALRTLGLGRMPHLSELIREAGHAPATGALPFDYLVGERDTRFRAIGSELGALFPRTRLIVVAGAGHNLLLEAPDAVAACLSSAPAPISSTSSAAAARPAATVSTEET